MENDWQIFFSMLSAFHDVAGSLEPIGALYIINAISSVFFRLEVGLRPSFERRSGRAGLLE